MTWSQHTSLQSLSQDFFCIKDKNKLFSNLFKLLLFFIAAKYNPY